MSARVLATHHINPRNRQLRIQVMDAPRECGASFHYSITGFNTASNPAERLPLSLTSCELLFNHGCAPDGTPNGITEAALLAILIDRYEGFQRGPLASYYNEQALYALRAALDALQARARDRASL